MTTIWLDQQWRISSAAIFGLVTLIMSATLAVVAASSEAAAPVIAATGNNCFQALAKGRSSTLSCVYPAWLGDQERDELRRLTRDLLQDARCRVAINVPRELVERALTAQNVTFQAPAQAVSCSIVTSDATIPVQATFAPRVIIKNGIAVDATPGMANVTGVNSYLAWPVVEYVNRSMTVKTEMLKSINAYLARRVARQG